MKIAPGENASSENLKHNYNSPASNTDVTTDHVRQRHVRALAREHPVTP